MYNFLLDMWKNKRINEEYLEKIAQRGFITQEKKESIIATEQYYWM